MKRAVVFLPEASDNVAKAVAWYHQQVVGLGKAFLAEANRQLRRISLFPESYPILLPLSRRANMHRFSYAIVYRIQPSVIEVIAVFHYITDHPH